MQMSSTKYNALNATVSFAKLIALRRFAIGAVPLHGGRQQGGQRQGAAAALRGGSALLRRGSACENGNRAVGQWDLAAPLSEVAFPQSVRLGQPWEWR